MRLGVVLAVVGSCLMVATHVAARKVSPRPRAAFVELDALVADDNGRPARGCIKRTSRSKKMACPSR